MCRLGAGPPIWLAGVSIMLTISGGLGISRPWSRGGAQHLAGEVGAIGWIADPLLAQEAVVDPARGIAAQLWAQGVDVAVVDATAAGFDKRDAAVAVDA